MPPTRRPRLRAGAGWLRRHWLPVIAALSLLGLAIAVDPRRLAAVLRQVELPVLGLMAPVTIGIYVFRGLGWHVALRHADVRIDLWRTLLIMFAGQTLIFMPTGDLARVAILEETSRRHEDEGAIAGTIAFQELVFMTLVGFGVLPRVLQHRDAALLVLLMTLAHLGVFTLLIWGRAYEWALRVVERFQLLRRFDPQLRSLRVAFLRMLRPWNLLAVGLCNAVAVALLFLLFYLATRAVGIRHLSLTEATFAYGLAHLLAGLSFLPGGIGSMEAIATGLLAARGIPASQAAAAALLHRGFNDVLMALLGLAAGIAVRRRR